MLPSDLMKRGNYNTILAEASRKSLKERGRPLNITKMKLDEAAAKRFVSSLNSERRLTYNSLAEKGCRPSTATPNTARRLAGT